MNIVALTPDRDHYIKPIISFLDYPLVFQRDTDWDDFLKKKPLAVIVLSDWTFDLSMFIEKCRKNRIPSILMMDGTIEWKHFFRNPKWSYGGNEAPYLPIYCDKAFVPGLSTYRFLEYFGNFGKCELTGIPRFDHYKNLKKEGRGQNKNIIGIMSANTAGYTPKQIEETKQLFTDLYTFFKGKPEYNIKWRLRKGFEKHLPFEVNNSPEKQLSEFLQNVDAVICQPSTAAYEAMIFDKPLALADYNIAPNYMQAAWQIRSSYHIEHVIEELINPTPMKIALQKQILEDTFSCIGYSGEVSGKIINAMVSQSQSNSDKEFIFPQNMALNFINKKSRLPVEISNMFPNRQYLELNDTIKLKELLVKAEKKIYNQNQLLKRRSVGFWIDLAFSKLIKKLRNE